MGMIIQHNMASMNANRNLGVTTGQLSKSTEKLSSGYRINRAGDDAAGLAISEKMRGQIRGLDQASSNSQDGISLIQTAEGALTETHSILQRMRELAVQASSDTNTDDDRVQIQNEIDQLTSEVDRIAGTTEFNTKKLLDGSVTGAITAKDGKTSLEGNFANSNVSVTMSTNNNSSTSITDVVRIEMTKNFTAGQTTKDPKLTDTQISDLYKYIEGGILSDGTTVTATKTADNTVDEAIKEAVKVAQAATKTTAESSMTASNAVKDNDVAIDTALDTISKTFNDAIKKASTSGTGVYAAGVTNDDIKAALNEYVLALQETGTLGKVAADGTVTEGTAGVATTAKAVEAEKKLAALFNTNSAEVSQATTIAADALTLGPKKANGTAGTDVKSAVVTKGTTTIGAAATDLLTKLKAAAGEIAATKLGDEGIKKNLEDREALSTALSDNALMNAVHTYGKADADNKTTQASATASDAAKAEAADKLTNAKESLDAKNSDKPAVVISDLFNNTKDKKNFTIDSKVGTDGSLNITMKNDDGTSNVITINNADKLKAGDVLTITAQSKVESKQAATGSEALRLQTGANSGQEVLLSVNSMKAKDLNIVQTKEGSEGKSLDLTSQVSASMAVNAYDMAIQKVSTERAKMGAVQNRLEHTISNLDTSAENLQSAESRIRDTDMASEMTQYSKSNILMQAGQSMLAQANQSNQGVLSLLQ